MIRRHLLIFFSLFLATGLFAQVDEEAALDAYKEFKNVFRSFKDPIERAEAVRTLKGNETAPAALELVKLLRHKDELVRIAAKEVLATYRKPDTFRGFIEQLPALKDQAQRALLIEILGNSRITDALPVMRELALNDKRSDALVKVAVVRAIETMKDRGSNHVLVAFLKDKEPVLRIAASDTIGSIRIRELGDALVPLLGDKFWQVQSSAISAVGKVRVEKAIDPLIALMRKGGRLKEETGDALFLITSRDYPLDPDTWEDGIKKLRGFGWKMPSDADVAKAKATRKKNQAFYGKKDSKNTFARITTTSTRVLFIIDISGSMEDHIVEKEKFDAGYESYEKLEIVKTELRNTIEALSPNTIFNIVAFATDLKPWKKRLVPANIVNRRAAMNWVRRLRPIGGKDAVAMAAVGLGSKAAKGKTNTFKALMFAFGIDPEKPVPRAAVTGGGSRAMAKKDLDTVFFLSDGKPSIGKLVDTEEIRKEVKRLNQAYRIVIHAIAIGQFQKTFLRGLARENGGVFVDLGS